MIDGQDPICRLELGQFSLEYEDLPLKETTENPVDNGLYRSRYDTRVWVYHAPDKWDCFVAA